ncbi:Phosphomannomutase [Ceratocystis lukuohia]|uniref:Phosphomannomutase n=3 Tax=Ceratocystis TaxID=5157 RepID=A0A0F8DHC8_CERFI|nr:Phosphomannomutase [Ceratocystis platani]PHH55051.1 Phosphomannomutase [Ceratocystis fimbriata CBS 114723]
MATPSYPPIGQRPINDTICLFDVDDTLTPARKKISPEMVEVLSKLRQTMAIGFVGGSDYGKASEQMGDTGRSVLDMFDFCFPENGLTAFYQGTPLPSANFIGWFGEEEYKKFVRFVLHYVADLDLPIKRGTFLEFRRGMVNISPIGRNASAEERNAYEKHDLEHKIREKFIAALKKEFSHMDLTYSIGGQISFDVFPTGWDKTYCLRHLEEFATKPDGHAFKNVHFFGDKTFEGGNDFQIFNDPRTIGHTVVGPADTAKQLSELFGI